MTEQEMRAEIDRLRRFISSVAGCTNCSACREVALRIVDAPWGRDSE